MQAVGRSRGGWTTKVHLVAVDARTAISPGVTTGALYAKRNEIEKLFRRLKGYRRILSRFEKLDGVFFGFVFFALVFEALHSVNTP